MDSLFQNGIKGASKIFTHENTHGIGFNNGLMLIGKKPQW